MGIKENSNVSSNKCKTINGNIAEPPTSQNSRKNATAERMHEVVNSMLRSYD
jgi:hypothetical protein